MFDCPMNLERVRDTVLVTFPDVPEAITFGDDEDEALLQAQDALETALSMYVDARRDLPRPGAAQGRRTVSPRVLSCAKLAVCQAMREQGVGKAELARRMNWHLIQVDRVLDLNHASRLDQVEAALAALGRRLRLEVMEAA